MSGPRFLRGLFDGSGLNEVTSKQLSMRDLKKIYKNMCMCMCSCSAVRTSVSAGTFYWVIMLLQSLVGFQVRIRLQLGKCDWMKSMSIAQLILWKQHQHSWMNSGRV